MTDPTPEPFRATPEQWQIVEDWAIREEQILSATVRELHDRVQLLEATQHAHIDTTALSAFKVAEIEAAQAQSLHSDALKMVDTLERMSILPEICDTLRLAIRTPMGVPAAEHLPAPYSFESLKEWANRVDNLKAAKPATEPAPPPLHIPPEIIRGWIICHGIYPGKNDRCSPDQRLGTNYSAVIEEAANWGQQQGWDAARAVPFRVEEAPPAEPAPPPGPDFSNGLRSALARMLDTGGEPWQLEASDVLRVIATWLRQRHGGSSSTADYLEAEANRP